MLGSLPWTVPAIAGEPADGTFGDRCTSRIEGAAIVLDCRPGFASRRDRIVIYPRNGETAIESALAASDGVWLFEPGASGRVALLVDFGHDEGGHPVARLYDDGDGDGTVEYVLVGGSPRALDHEGRPTVTVTGLDRAWVVRGRTSFNLDITVDGQVRASFWSAEFLDLLDNDGRTDFDVRVRDEDRDGRPDLEWRQFRPPLPENQLFARFVRTEVTRSSTDSEPAISGSLLWPYLAQTPREPADVYVNPYGASLPPIEVDWPHARITKVAEFVASRAPSNYYVNSIKRIEEGTTTAPNFENPVAFYDLAGADDGRPDLSIRFKATLPLEIEAPRRNADPINEITYSWGTRHDHTWSYALSLVGHQRVSATVPFPAFTIRAIPPADLPRWIGSRGWDAATLVEAPAGYASQEGIGEYGVEQADSVLAQRYLSGVDSVPPVTTFSAIPEGFRGEYAFDLGEARPRLYVHPVDHRLHLVGAEGGVWNLGDRRELRYERLRGPGIDHWTLVEDGAVAADLRVLDGQAVFSNADGVRIGRAADVAMGRALVPPRDLASWDLLRARLEAAAPSFAPDDLAAMFDRIATSVQELPGASIRELRPGGKGFHLVLSLTRRSGAGPWLAALDPGTHVITYGSAGGYAVAEPLPPDVVAGAVGVVGADPRAGEPAELEAAVENRGNVDGRALVVFAAGRDRENLSVLGSVLVDVPAGTTVPAGLIWLPRAGGDWFVRASVYGATGGEIVSLVSVADAPRTDSTATLASQRIPGPPLLLAAILLVLAAFASGFVGSRLLRP